MFAHLFWGCSLINALEIPSDINLAAFSQFLSRGGLKHRITEEGLNQVVWVATDMEASFVQSAFAQVQSGELTLGSVDSAVDSTGMQLQLASRFLSALRRYPATLALILISLVFFPVGMGVDNDTFSFLFRQMMFLATEKIAGQYYFASLAYTFESGQWWRLLTPMFVHFSVLHLVFNSLWVWEIGRRIEFENGAASLMIVAMVTSLASNLTQFFMAGPGLFGGLSGVVFGFLGYSLIWSRLVPARSLRVPPGIYIFMLVYLAIGFTGAIDLLGMGSLANGAHLGGLIGGLVTGVVAGLLARAQRNHPA